MPSLAPEGHSGAMLEGKAGAWRGGHQGYRLGVEQVSSDQPCPWCASCTQDFGRVAEHGLTKDNVLDNMSTFLLIIGPVYTYTKLSGNITDYRSNLEPAEVISECALWLETSQSISEQLRDSKATQDSLRGSD